MPQRNVASNFTFEQQRVEINELAADFWTHKGTVDTAAGTYLLKNGSNAFTGATLAVPAAFTINSDSGNGTVTINGNLQVDGTTTTLNSTTLEIADKNIVLAKGSSNDAAADGAGITVDSATDKTFTFVDGDNAFVSSIGLKATTGVFSKNVTATSASAGGNALLVTGLYDGSNPNVDIQTWQRTGGAVQAKLVYKDGTTDMSFGTDTAHTFNLMTGGVGRTKIFSDGKLVHTANKDNDYLAEFHQAHTSNSAQILINSPTDNNTRPASIDLANAGTLKWSLGQAYSSTSAGAFHIATSALQSNENGVKLTITTAGRVGINKVNPQRTLDIVTSNNENGFCLDTIGTSPNYQFDLRDDGVVQLRVGPEGQVLIGTDTVNTSDIFTIVDPGNAFMSLRSDQQADGNSQVIDFAVGTGNRASGNLVSTITAAIPTGATAGGTLKGYLAFSSNAGDSLAERVRINEYGNLVAGINPTTSSSGSGKHNVPLCVHGPDKNAITLMLGNSANGVNAFGANDYSADIRFNGSNVAWGDISYYPNGDGSNGSFRFTRNGSTVSNNGNAAIGCGGLTCNGGIVQNDNSAETAFGSKSLPAADSGYYVRNGNGSTGTYASIGLIASSTAAASDQSASLVVKCTASGLSPEVYLTQRDGNNSQRNVLAINTLGDATFIGSLSDHKGNLRRLPQTNKSAGYNLVTADAGKHINTTGDVGLYTGNFEIGDAVTIFNKGTAAIAISLGGGVTMYQAGTANVGNRGLDAKGVCTILCTEKGSGTNTFVISGAGLT